MFNWIIGIPLLSLFAVVGLAMFVIPSTRGEPSRSTLNSLLVLVALCTFSSTMFHSISYPSTVFWLYLVLLFGLFTGAVGVHFSVQFAGYHGRKTKWVVGIFYVLAIFLSSILISGYLVEGATLLLDGSVDIQWGHTSPLLWGTIVCCIFAAVIFLTVSLFRSSQADRRHTLFPLIGFIVMCIGALSNIYVSAYPIDIATNFVFVSFLTYGVVRGHLLKPPSKLPWPQSLSLSIFLLALCYAALLAFFRVWMGYSVTIANVTAGLITIVFCIATLELIRIPLLKLFERVLFPSTYHYRQALSKLAGLEGSLISLDNSITNALNIIVNATHANGAALLLKNDKTGYFESAYAAGNAMVNMLQIKLPSNSPVIIYISAKGTPTSDEEIRQRFDIRVYIRGEDDILKELDPTLYYAINDYSGPLAILVITKVSGGGQNEDETRDFIKLAGQQIATNIINSKLYETIKREGIERNRINEALRVSEEKHRILLEEAPIAICNVDLRGKITYINKKFEGCSGYSKTEIVGKNGFKLDMFSPETLKYFTKRLRERLMGSPPKRWETRFKCKDGRQIWVEIEGRLLKEHGIPVGFQLAATDLTERKEIEEKTREAATLKELDRLRTELLANVSHELRTPLSSIKGFSTMMLEYEKRLTADDKRQYLKTIDGATDRLVELIDQLLDMSRLDVGMLTLDKKATNIKGLFKETINEARIRSKAHRIVTDFAPRLPIVHVDAKRIRQVVDNLISNAVNYSNPGTDIVICVRQQGNELLTSVTDHGIGIPEDDQPRLFERMFRSQKRQGSGVGGAGLGLAICKGLVEAHGGRIWIESKEGKGTICFFTLPTDSEAGITHDKSSQKY